MCFRKQFLVFSYVFRRNARNSCAGYTARASTIAYGYDECDTEIANPGLVKSIVCVCVSMTILALQAIKAAHERYQCNKRSKYIMEILLKRRCSSEKPALSRTTLRGPTHPLFVRACIYANFPAASIFSLSPVLVALHHGG